MGTAADLRTMPDELLGAQCRWEAFRGPGPGGQKRNKTSSAIRVTHLPTGLSAIAMETRSQHQNRSRALARLRHRLVLEIRDSIDRDAFSLPAWFAELAGSRGLLGVGLRCEQYLPMAGLVLDVLAAAGWSVSGAAQALGVSTANLVKFLARDPPLWAKVNQMRRAAGLRTLAMPRD